MAIEIRETFQVRAPLEAVWPFVIDPHKVVTCMPGAKLVEVVDARTFVGSVQVKVGAITTSYKGRVQLTEVDEQGHVVRMVAEGRETGGGAAKGTMSSRLRSLPDGQTEVVTEASVDLTGRIMQVGRGMIQGVSQQLFLQFVASLKQHLEVAEAAGSSGAVGTGAQSPPGRGVAGDMIASEAKAIRVLPLMLQVLWAAVLRFFRQLSGRRTE
jgi:carbon monoxide dehydrogenase subunit G